MSTINCNGKLLDLSVPRIMGILNITTDSFYDGNRYRTDKQILDRVGQMLEEGADIIDIGAVSTRPGALIMNEEEEKNKLIPILKLLLSHFPDIIISVDTYRAGVAIKSIEEGASIVNDISGGGIDNSMFEAIISMNCPYILSHIKGIPENMQKDPMYDNIIKEMILYFSEKIKILREGGVKDIIIDPGLGFGKTIHNNYEIIKKMKYIDIFNLPILIGISRKSMLYKLLDITPSEALNATTVLNTLCLVSGAKILRVHDVKEANQAIKITQFIENIH
ncbi:MAG: dihydropteroate synthase [Bacteroidota bacterium]|nr:dihydropteroate synthase [Bacteroidota bacterium]